MESKHRYQEWNKFGGRKLLDYWLGYHFREFGIELPNAVCHELLLRVGKQGNIDDDLWRKYGATIELHDW